MATIYKRGRIWWIAYKDRDGRRKQKSTGLGDRKAAEALKRHYGALEKSHRLIGTPLAGGIRISDLRIEYSRNREGRKAAKTLNQDRIALDSLQAAVGDPFVSDVKPEILEQWYSDLIQRRSSATANSYFRHVRAFLNYAVKRRYLGESPAKEVDTVSAVERKTRTLSRDEAARLLSILPPAWADLARVSLYSGARAGELCRMKAADLDPDCGAVTIASEPEAPTKSRRFRVVPLPSASRPFFQSLSERANGFLLRTERGNPWRVEWISRGFTRNAKRAGVPCTFHDLRRTYGGWLVMSGADLTTVKENMGHSDISVTVRHYVHLVMDHKRAQVDRLPEL